MTTIAIPPHIALLLTNADLGMTCFRLTKALDVPELHHTLPGLLLDLTAAYEALLDRVTEHHPDITEALAAGRRSTTEIAP